MTETFEKWLTVTPGVRLAPISTAARKLLYEMSQQHIEHERPDWDHVFLQMAHDIAKRSPDAETQVGAVIVDQNKHILSVGYNGFMPGVNDNMIPNIRPHKYPWVIHAELNALLNCETRPRGATLYCTLKPCQPCFQSCVAAGIAELVYINVGHSQLMNSDVEWEVLTWLAKDKITVRGVDFTPQDG